MRNRKGTIRKIAAGVALLAILALGAAFLTTGQSRSAHSEAVETFYGKAIFGGQYAWLDNVKRPGLSASYASASALNFDFGLRDAISSTTVNSSESMEFIASITGVPYGSGYTGPFDNELLTKPIRHEQVFFSLPDIDTDDDDNGKRGDGPSDDPDEEEDLPVVPAPGSISLALIGLAAVAKYRKK